MNCSILVIVVPSRRLDDRIRDLCDQVVNAPETEKRALLKELRSAIREKITRLREMAARKLLGGNTNHRDRRSRDDGTHPLF